MKKMKITAKELKIKSFVTSIESDKIFGGIQESEWCNIKTHGYTCPTYAPYVCYPE